MKREIKFRAWEYKRHKMWPDVQDTYDCELSDSFGCLLYNEEYSVMQFTGLKDKNGKEIYEGDIVVDAWDETVAEIIFDRCSFKLKGDKGKFKKELLGNFVSDNIEVIGNIYEKFELLK